MNKQITKNQHYVPQCLLKHFCFDAKKGKINVFDIERSVVRDNQSVKEVFSQNYFYGKDNKVETFMAKIEGSASKVLDKIVAGDFTIADEDVLTLHMFILSLFQRTPAATKRVIEFVNSYLESVVRELLIFNGFDPKEASAGRLNFDQDKLASEITVQGVVNAPILRDLEYHIIKNETASEFYISDHPVFIYNWLYRKLEHPGVTSITATGLQIFLPLSPQITLCLYDPKVYKYGQKGLVTCVSKDEDIEILNSFQLIQSDSIIGFHSQQDQANVKRLYPRSNRIKLHQYESGILSTQEEDEGKIRSIHYVLTRQARLRKMPSFVKIKKKSRSYASSYQERYPELSANYCEFIKRLINEQRQHSVIEYESR